MISNAVADELARQITSLTVGTNLFAESGQGTQYVVVKTTNVVNTAEPIDDFRQSTMQILINGYSANKGAILASQIVKVLQNIDRKSTRLNSSHYS